MPSESIQIKQNPAEDPFVLFISQTSTAPPSKIKSPVAGIMKPLRLTKAGLSD